MKVRNTSDQSCDKIKMIIYGRAGAGKTTLIKTLPGRVFVVSAESGLLPLRGSSIDFIDITEDDSGKMIPDTARTARLLEAHAWIINHGQQYDWIVLDSFTEITEIVVAEMRDKYNVTEKRKDTLPMYQEIYHRLRMIVKGFRDLPFNVMLTALSEPNDLGGGQYFHSILAQGKIKTMLAGMFDLVTFVQVLGDENKTRRLVCRENPYTESKDRSGQLEMVMPPDLQLAMNKILGAGESYEQPST